MTYTQYKGPLDYLAIRTWLKVCEDDFECRQDKHEYTTLVLMFDANSCTRIDDITQMSADRIKMLAEAQGINMTIGLINCVYTYTIEDVAHVKDKGKLSI